jgi:hypothetical protein
MLQITGNMASVDALRSALLNVENELRSYIFWGGAE